MLEVKIEKILPVTEARDSFNKLVDEVEGSDELFVLTKNGKPAAVLVGVHHLEKLTGTSEEELMEQTNLTQPADDSSANSASAMPADNSTITNTNTDEETAEQTTAPAPEAPETAPEQAPESAEPAAPEQPTEPETPAVEASGQPSGATATPFGDSETSAPSADAPNEDPLDFLNDSDMEPTPAETPSAAPSTTEPTPVAEAPAQPTPAPETPSAPAATPEEPAAPQAPTQQQ